jgi:hypothetical protein
MNETVPKPQRRCAAVLLEVILALVLFFSGATVILGSLSSSINALRRVRLEAQGVDLATTLLSEIQMGLVDVADAGPEDYEDESLAEWGWQIVTSPSDNTALDVPLTRVEIIIFNKTHGYTYRLVHLFPEQGEGEFTAGRNIPEIFGGTL